MPTITEMIAASKNAAKEAAAARAALAKAQKEQFRELAKRVVACEDIAELADLQVWAKELLG